jgi:Initiator Replication protein
MSSRTIEQRTNYLGFPKPGELIEMVGTHTLEASDRAVLNILYRHAHDSGRLGEPGAKWEIPLGVVREAFSSHESGDRLKDSLKRLKSVVVSVSYLDQQVGKKPEQRIVITGLFSFFDISAGQLEKRATLRYQLPPELVPIIAQSGYWGRIKAEIVCAMTSKYAIALYEQVQLRANMNRCVETIEIGRFRDMLGVPPKSYKLGPDFMRFVLKPAMLEVNGLSDMGVEIQLQRRHARAPVAAVTMTWWRKRGDEFRAAMAERNQPKVGRMARLKGQVEQLTPDRVALVNAEVIEKLEEMRAEERAKLAAE